MSGNYARIGDGNDEAAGKIFGPVRGAEIGEQTRGVICWPDHQVDLQELQDRVPGNGDFESVPPAGVNGEKDVVCRGPSRVPGAAGGDALQRGVEQVGRCAFACPKGERGWRLRRVQETIEPSECRGGQVDMGCDKTPIQDARSAEGLGQRRQRNRVSASMLSITHVFYVGHRRLGRYGSAFRSRARG